MEWADVTKRSPSIRQRIMLMRSSPEAAEKDADREVSQIQLCCRDDIDDSTEAQRATIEHLHFRAWYHRRIADRLEELASRIEDTTEPHTNSAQ